MHVERINVAPGVDLAVDRWPGAPARGPRRSAGAASSGQRAFVLVHGLASNARMWDGVATALSDLGHDVVTVDLRGHGRSSKPDDGYGVATVAGDLAMLIDRLGLVRPIVAGQSWGGNVVLELAARHGECLGGAVLVDGGWLDLQAAFPDWESCARVLAPPHLVGRPFEEMERYVRSAHPDWPETGIRGALANFEVRADGTIAPWLTFDRHMLVLRGLWEHRPADRYGSVSVPVVLVPADGDDTDRLAQKRVAVAAAAAALPLAEVRWFVGHHDIHAEHPVELAVMLDDQTVDGCFA